MTRPRHSNAAFPAPSTKEVMELATRYGVPARQEALQIARSGGVDVPSWNPETATLRSRTSSGDELSARVVNVGGDWQLTDVINAGCGDGSICAHVLAMLMAYGNLVAPGLHEPEPVDWAEVSGSWLRGSGNRGQIRPLALYFGTNDNIRTESLSVLLLELEGQMWRSDRLSFASLAASSGISDRHPAGQVRAVRALWAVAGGDRRNEYGYSPYGQYGQYGGGYGRRANELELAGFTGAALVPLLQEAQREGVALLFGPEGAETVRFGPPVDLRIDAMLDEDGALHMRPTFAAGEDGWNPDVVIGEPAQAVGRVEQGDLVLRPLSRSAPAAIGQSALRGNDIVVPASDRTMFVLSELPDLASAVEFQADDGVFDPPEIGPPTLVLRLTPMSADLVYGVWEWAYDIDGRTQTNPMSDRSGGPWRDADAEWEITDRVTRALGADFGWSDVQQRGLTGNGTLNLHARFDGEAVIDLVENLIGVINGIKGASVVVDGDLPTFHDVTDDTTIEVSTSEIPEDHDWFDLNVVVRADDVEVPFEALFTALSRRQRRLILDDGAHLSLDDPAFTELRSLIDEARLLQDPAKNDRLRISRYQVGLWEELAALGVVTAQAERWKEQVAALAGSADVEPADVPDALDATLRPYQLEGFQWLERLTRHGLGGVLADDMGLGKTVQTLATIQSHRDVAPDGPPFLVIAPASVVSGWVEQASMFTPGLRIRSIPSTLRKAGMTAAHAVADVDVVVTSHARFRLDGEAYATQEWSGLFVDEAQFAKNYNSKLYGSIRKLGAPFVVAVTGTPMENNLMELWAVLSMAAPGLFPNRARFSADFARPITRNNDRVALARLRRLIDPLMLRRTKEQVALDLPDKQEVELRVELTGAHRKAYDTELQRQRAAILGLTGSDADLDRNYITVLASLMKLRQASLHAGLVNDRLARTPSAKVDTLVDHLQEAVARGHRALVFSSFTGFLGIVRARLAAENIATAYLDGGTRNRDDVIASFKSGDAPVFLISLKAGGTGLNLTEADYVFLLDPWWNPAAEEQAADRAHRIGQTRNVVVYRLIAEDTIEDKVRALARRKAELTEDVMAGTGGSDSKFTLAQIRDLLGLPLGEPTDTAPVERPQEPSSVRPMRPIPSASGPTRVPPGSKGDHAARIAKARRAAGVSVEEAASLASMPAKTWINAERPNINTQFRTLRRIQQVLDRLDVGDVT